MQDWSEATPAHTSIPFDRPYTLSDEPETTIFKQNLGNFTLDSGAEVHIRSFGIFNLSLWDDVMAELAPFSDRDTLIVGARPLLPLAAALLLFMPVAPARHAASASTSGPSSRTAGPASFGWTPAQPAPDALPSFPRRSPNCWPRVACSLRTLTPLGCMQSLGPGTRASTSTAATCTSPGCATSGDMYELFTRRLSAHPATVLWRSYGPSHFGGMTGTYTGTAALHFTTSWELQFA